MPKNEYQLRVMEYGASQEYSIMTATIGYFSLAAMVNLSTMTEMEWEQIDLYNYCSRDKTATARIVPAEEPILKNSKDIGYSI